MEYWKPKSFDLWSSSLHRDETDNLRIIRDFQLRTDAWIPLEIAEEMVISELF